jgi:cytochrome c-type biogenesis protein CcmH
MLGWSYFETGDLMRSAAAYRKATELEPGNAENWSSLGEALQSASKDVSPEAATPFERAIKLDRAIPARVTSLRCRRTFADSMKERSPTGSPC